jgi:hypothetical protein
LLFAPDYLLFCIWHSTSEMPEDAGTFALQHSYLVA